MAANVSNLRRSFFARPATAVAADLIGTVLMLGGAGGIIVECEAYDTGDAASHSYRGRRTVRTEPMFGPPGHAYVYRAYGLHWCLNLVCGDHDGQAVLIRALEPVAGIETMKERRGTDDLRLLCKGPGRLCTALAIDQRSNGADLVRPPFQLMRTDTAVRVHRTRRVGISKAVALKRRFVLLGSKFLTRAA
jgi:DNA-3-methyladenine glycosylase